MPGPVVADVRVAAYWAPAVRDPLWHLGCTWLGRDPETGAALPQPNVPGITDATADARLYGFHATLKAPMRVATCWDALRADAVRIAAGLRPFDLPPLRLSNLSGFLALTEAEPSEGLQALADAIVAGLDAHRGPPLPGELDRRRAGGLSPEAEAMLVRWGYPAAFGTWRFHMTLTCRLPDGERAPFQAAAARHFAPALTLPRRAEEVCLFVQPGPGLPFTLAERLPLGG